MIFQPFFFADLPKTKKTPAWKSRIANCRPKHSAHDGYESRGPMFQSPSSYYKPNGHLKQWRQEVEG